MTVVYSLFYKYGNKKDLLLRGTDMHEIYAELRKYAKRALNNDHEIFFNKHGFILGVYGNTGYYIKAKKVG